jgi:sugar lactone lactonase YvrE
LTSFDASAFELPEGLAVRDDELLVGFAFNSMVEQFDLEGGARSPFATLPVPAPNTGFLTGLTSDSAGAVFAALVSFTGDPTAGVYRIPAGGGEPTLFASDAELVFPNGFAWDDAGTLFVTDSATSKVFRVAPSGAAEVWSSDALLAGDPTVCGGQPEDISVGANGIVWTPEAVFVASSDQALVVRIPVLADGSAGVAEPFTTPDCDLLAGLDGLALDDDGSLVGAVNRSDRLVRINAAGEVEVLLEGPPLDFPASLAFHGSGEERALYVTNFALNRALAGQPASPALLRVRF